METYNLDSVLLDLQGWWNRMGDNSMMHRQSAQGAGHHSGIGSGNSSEQSLPIQYADLEEQTVSNVAIGLPTGTHRREVPSTDIQPDEGLGARHPIKKPNTRPDRSRSVQVGDRSGQKNRGRAVPNPKKHWYEHLTGYIGWWRRVEKEGGNKPCKSVCTNNQSGEDAKLTFLRKFYPAAHTTPGGTTKLETKNGQSSATTMGRGHGSIDRACNQNFNFSSPSKKRKVDFSRKLNFWRFENTLTSNLEELPGGSAASTKKSPDLAHFTD